MTEKITTREFWIKEPGRAAIVEGILPAVDAGSVRVRTLYSAVSRGTESLVFRGRVPESQHRAMRCPFQEGHFPAPVKYGYMSVGLVEAAGRDAADLEGSVVFCLHPHQDRYVVPADAVVPVPPDVPPERAVVAANMETAVNVAWDARPGVGDRIAVVGGGVVGLFAGWLAAGIPGTRVTLVDPAPERTEAAEALGMDHATTPPEGLDADRVIHASGDPAGLADALELAAPEATVVEASWFGDRSVPLPLGEAFHARRITIRSSQVGRIPPDRAPRWDHRRRMGLALRLLRDPVLDLVFTGESDFEELPAVMERLADDGGSTLCHRVRYPQAGPA